MAGSWGGGGCPPLLTTPAALGCTRAPPAVSRGSVASVVGGVVPVAATVVEGREPQQLAVVARAERSVLTGGDAPVRHVDAVAGHAHAGREVELAGADHATAVVAATTRDHDHVTVRARALGAEAG